ncbi:hypothetical protein [Taibaiella sp. KBW10]|uniref:hypothetical protein n=1 Tax=Taibaiella sp. KBW10 TaxID=2153357 RepID=UPI000F5A710C|nr:hypothetical protein [Taibaiella sp. KBW10]
MRTNLIICFAFISLLLSGCQKKGQSYRMTVVKDCTGTYLRYDHKDYLVCNYAALRNYAHAAALTVTYNRIDNCTQRDPDLAFCEMLHAHEGWIKVASVQP